MRRRCGTRKDLGYSGAHVYKQKTLIWLPTLLRRNSLGFVYHDEYLHHIKIAVIGNCKSKVVNRLTSLLTVNCNNLILRFLIFLRTKLQQRINLENVLEINFIS